MRHSALNYFYSPIHIQYDPSLLFQNVNSANEKKFNQIWPFDSANPSDPKIKLRNFLVQTGTPHIFYFGEFESGQAGLKLPEIENILDDLMQISPEFSDRVHHLITWAGQNEEQIPRLFSSLRPVFNSKTDSPFLIKTSDGILTLNRRELENFLGEPFDDLDENQLFAATQMRPHGVNPLLSAKTLEQNLQLEIVFDPTFFDAYFQNPNLDLQIVEIPVGDKGQTHSVFLPLEYFLAFLIQYKKNFDSVQIPKKEGINNDNLESLIDSINAELAPEKWHEIELDLEAPVLGNFGKICQKMTQKISVASPHLPPKMLGRMVKNFAHHFLAREFKIIQKSLEPNADLDSNFESLAQTEFGSILADLRSRQDFKNFISRQREIRANQKIVLPVSSETAKSETYFGWQKKMARIAPRVLQKIVHQNQTPISQIFEKLQIELISFFPKATDRESLSNASADFVEIIFGSLQSVLQKMQQKHDLLSGQTSESVDELTQIFWHQKAAAIRKISSKDADAEQKNFHQKMIKRALLPDAILFFQLSFAKLLAQNPEDLTERFAK